MKEYYENENRLYKNILNMPDQLLMLDNSKLTPLQSNSILAMLHNSQIKIKNLDGKPVEYLFDYKFEIKISDLKIFNNLKKTENLINDNLYYIKDNVQILQNQIFQSFDSRSFNSFIIFPEITVSVDNFENMTLRYQLSTTLLKIMYNRKGYIDTNGEYADDKTLYTPIYLDLLKESGLSKKSEICLYKMLLCLGLKFYNHPTKTIMYPIEEFKMIVGLSSYKKGEKLSGEIKDLFDSVIPHINFTPVYEYVTKKTPKTEKILAIKIKCKYVDFSKDEIYNRYKGNILNYEENIEINNETLLSEIENRVKK